MKRNSVDLENNNKEILNDIKKSDIVSNEREEVEKEHKRDTIHKRLDVKEDNIVKEKRTRKKPNKLNL